MNKIFFGERQAITVYYGKDMRTPLSINASGLKINDLRNLQIQINRLLSEAFVYDSFPEEYRYDTYHTFIRKK